MLTELREFAAAKLIGSSSATAPSKPEVVFAVLSTRLCIELEPMRESAGDIGQKLVASHLRVVYNIPDHRAYLAMAMEKDTMSGTHLVK